MGWDAVSDGDCGLPPPWVIMRLPPLQRPAEGEGGGGIGTLKAFTTPERPRPAADVKMITRDFSLESPPFRREML